MLMLLLPSDDYSHNLKQTKASIIWDRAVKKISIPKSSLFTHIYFCRISELTVFILFEVAAVLHVRGELFLLIESGLSQGFILHILSLVEFWFLGTVATGLLSGRLVILLLGVYTPKT